MRTAEQSHGAACRQRCGSEGDEPNFPAIIRRKKELTEGLFQRVAGPEHPKQQS
jgi:hypothetical protein